MLAVFVMLAVLPVFVVLAARGAPVPALPSMTAAATVNMIM